MAGERSPEELTYPAGADLSTYQFRAVYQKTDGSVDVIATNTGTPAIGVLTNKPAAAGRPARVCKGGITKMEAQASLSAGQYIVASSDGRGSPIALGVSGTFFVLGQAVGTAGASGDIFEIHVSPQHYSKA